MLKIIIYKGDTGMMDEESKMIYNALRDRKAEGGINGPRWS